MIPDAVINPDITGCDKKFAKNPNLKKPKIIKKIPDMNAKVIAAIMYSEDPGRANFPIEAAVKRETTATGPTANVRLVPKIAYKIIGSIEA